MPRARDSRLLAPFQGLDLRRFAGRLAHMNEPAPPSQHALISTRGVRLLRIAIDERRSESLGKCEGDGVSTYAISTLAVFVASPLAVFVASPLAVFVASPL